MDYRITPTEELLEIIESLRIKVSLDPDGDIGPMIDLEKAKRELKLRSLEVWTVNACKAHWTIQVSQAGFDRLVGLGATDIDKKNRRMFFRSGSPALTKNYEGKLPLAIVVAQLGWPVIAKDIQTFVLTEVAIAK